MASELASYTEIANVLENLPMLAKEIRRARRMTIRDAAGECGLAFSTFNSVELGHKISMPVALAVIRWMDNATPPARPRWCGPDCECTHAAEEYS